MAINTQDTVPKLGGGTIAFICILTISAIVAPYIIVNTYKQDIVDYKKTIEDKLPQQPETFTTSNFTTYGKVENNNNWIGNINAYSGFRFTADSKNQTTAKLIIKYKSDNRGGKLNVNGEIQNLYFPSTNWNWGTKEVIAQLKQGINTIEFCGGFLTDYAPDIAEIKIVPDNNIKQDDIVGVWKGTYSTQYGKGTVTLTINDDMKGTFDYYWKGSYDVNAKGIYSVYANISNGQYFITGKDWIVHPGNHHFAYFSGGTIFNGVFKGTNFELYKLEKSAITPTVKQNEITLTPPEPKKVEPKEPEKEQYVDYSAKVETAVSNAIAACENGNWDDAYKYYTEAASYPTARSNQIKQTAANKFYEKAKGFIDRNGECDDFTKKLLRYANNLYSSSEIRNLLNRCGGGTTGSVMSNSSRFPQASERILSSSDLSGLSKYDLKIMRNEIFARHGYIFTTSDMKQYFSNQSWYSPRYGNVTSMLTNIEQKNIAFIKRYE